jgi:hypothetical protein
LEQTLWSTSTRSTRRSSNNSSKDISNHSRAMGLDTEVEAREAIIITIMATGVAVTAARGTKEFK